MNKLKQNKMKVEIKRNPIDFLDNTKKEFTEANMWEFALDYFEEFCREYQDEGSIDPIKVDLFLSNNIKKFKK